MIDWVCQTNKINRRKNKMKNTRINNLKHTQKNIEFLLFELADVDIEIWQLTNDNEYDRQSMELNGWACEISDII